MVDFRDVVVSVIFADRVGHVEILAVAACIGSYFNDRCRDLDICELRSLVVEADLKREKEPVDAAMDAGFVSYERDVFDVRKDEEGDHII